MSTCTVNLCQWNAQNLSHLKAQELAIFAQDHSSTILCISELGHRRRIPGFANYIASDQFTQSGIFWTDQVMASPFTFPGLTAFESTRIAHQAILINSEVILLHAYIAPDVPVPVRRSFWHCISTFITHHPTIKLIITGDLNPRDRRFGSNHTQHYAYLDPLLDDGTLQVLSNPNTPTRKNSTLDITLCTAPARNVITRPTFVHTDLHSDHCPTTTATSLPTNSNPPNTQTCTSVDVKASILYLEGLLQNAAPTPDLENFHNMLLDCIITRTSKASACKIWNDHLARARKARNKARRKLRRHRRRGLPTHALKANYHALSQAFKHLFTRAKHKHHRRVAKEAAKDVSGRSLWTLIRQLEPRLNKRGRQWIPHTLPASHECDSIANKFASISNSDDIGLTPNANATLQHTLTTLHHRCHNNPCFTPRELLQALRKSNARAAKGPDGISARLVLAACQNNTIFSAFLDAINTTVINQLTIPPSLKRASIIPLPKSTPGEWRPISLLNATSKIIESLIEMRLREATFNKLNPIQFGGRPGHNAGHALNRLFHSMAIAEVEHKHWAALFYDFRKAYDRVPKHRLINKLASMNVPPYLTLIIHSWLTDRTFTVRHRSAVSSEHQQVNGIPQGSSLSVLLWLLFINDIPVPPQTSNIYVDDTVHWALAPTRADVLNTLQQTANDVAHWCTQNSVLLNLQKTTLLWNNHKKTSKIHINGVIVRASRHARYLGASLFHPHSNTHQSRLALDLTEVARDIHVRCRYIAQLRKYKLPTRLFQAVCSAFIGGKLNYYTTWLSAEPLETIRPLELAYRHYMRVYSGAFTSTPIPLLHATTGFPLLADKIKIDTTMNILSGIAADNITGNDYLDWDRAGQCWSPYRTAWNLLRTTAPDLDNLHQSTVRLRHRDLEALHRAKFRLATRTRALSRHARCKLLKAPPHAISSWSDGSYSPGAPGGAACIISSPHTSTPPPSTPLQQTLQLPLCASPYEAELHALALALHNVAELTPKHRKIHHHTDSYSCLAQLHSLTTKPVLVHSGVKTVIKAIAALLKRRNTLVLRFVPSHADIGFSTDVDALAKLACRQPPSAMPTPFYQLLSVE